MATSKKRSTASAPTALAPLEHIEEHIHLIRGHKVMLDSDLAELYGVQTKALNQAVKRNLDRFPDDFMFGLTREEVAALNRSQFVTGSQKHRDPRFPPYVFTELGVAMLSSVLNSDRAIQANIAIMRAFVRLRSILAAHKDLARRIEELEKNTEGRFTVVFKLIAQIIREEKKPKRKIGFRTTDKD